MQNISLDSVLSDKTLNIFTDASISKYPGTNIVTGCSGAEFYIGDKYIYTDIQVLFNTTNNHAELMSILLGVYGAVQNMQIADTINLFSDSKINVSALREWIFKWVNDRFDDTLYNSAGHPVANQKLMLSVIDIITRNNLQINIFMYVGI